MCTQADATGTIVKFLTPNGAPVTVGQVSIHASRMGKTLLALIVLLAILQE